MDSNIPTFIKEEAYGTHEEYVRHLENIIFLMPGHVYWLDTNNVYVGCNQRQASFFGLNSPKDVVGKTNKDLIPDKTEAEKVDGINLNVMKSGLPRTIEESVVLAAGQQRIYLSEKVPLRNSKGHITGLLGISFDITERKEIEHTLSLAKEKATSANKSRNEFIRNMEHDIRTPVAGIVGINQYLKMIEEDPQKRMLLEDVESSATELTSYFNDALEMAYIVEENPILYKKFNMKALVNGVWRLELPAAKNKKLMFTIEYADDMQEWVIGDEFRIKRVLINLISNAIKFTESGSIVLKVQLAKKISSKKIVVFIIVKDTGCGIPEEKQNFLFEKLNKNRRFKSGLYKGIGLGLRVIRKFIKELDGEIEVISNLNKGTEFRCIIPLELPII